MYFIAKKSITKIADMLNRIVNPNIDDEKDNEKKNSGKMIFSKNNSKIAPEREEGGNRRDEGVSKEAVVTKLEEAQSTRFKAIKGKSLNKVAQSRVASKANLRLYVELLSINKGILVAMDLLAPGCIAMLVIMPFLCDSIVFNFIKYFHSNYLPLASFPIMMLTLKVSA